MPRRSKTPPPIPSAPPQEAACGALGFFGRVPPGPQGPTAVARARVRLLSVGAEVIEPELVETGLVPVRSTSTSLATLAGRSGSTATSALEAWLADKHANTISRYRGDLGDFAAWWLVERAGSSPQGEAAPVGIGEGGLSVPHESIILALQTFMDLSQPVAFEFGLRYRTWLKAKRLSANSINRKLSALRSYIKLAKKVNVCDWDLQIAGLEVELVRDVKGPGAQGYQDLVVAAEARVTAAKDDRSRVCWIRNVALLRLYHDAGLRRFEPLTVDYPEDVELGGNPRLRILRKKRREKAWFELGSARAVRAVRAWLEVRGEEPGPLFLSLRHGYAGQRLLPRAINSMFDLLGADVGQDVTPHGLRHTAATTLLDKSNGNVRAVAEFLGHKGLDIVQKYDDERQQQAKKMGKLLDD